MSASPTQLKVLKYSLRIVKRSRPAALADVYGHFTYRNTEIKTEITVWQSWAWNCTVSPTSEGICLFYLPLINQLTTWYDASSELISTFDQVWIYLSSFLAKHYKTLHFQVRDSAMTVILKMQFQHYKRDKTQTCGRSSKEIKNIPITWD